MITPQPSGTDLISNRICTVWVRGCE